MGVGKKHVPVNRAATLDVMHDRAVPHRRFVAMTGSLPHAVKWYLVLDAAPLTLESSTIGRKAPTLEVTSSALAQFRIRSNQNPHNTPQRRATLNATASAALIRYYMAYLERDHLGDPSHVLSSSDMGLL